MKMKTYLPHLPELQRSSIGLLENFERFLDDNGIPTMNATSYPPYNISKTEGDSDTYTVEVAVAGFALEDLEVVKQDRLLEIKGTKKEAEKDDSVMVHRGIANRSFVRSFALGENVEVRNIELENGILTVQLEVIVPEEKKPQTLKINAKS